MDILDRIYEQSKEDVAKRRKKVRITDFRSYEGYEHMRKSLYEALQRDENTPVRIIAEIKKASPSQGIIRNDFNPVAIAEEYIQNGAAAISVLTDEPFFQGSLEYLQQVAAISPIPVLRKDFIHDFYQIEEARAHGADAILLIATMLDPVHLSELHYAATEIGLECLVECYDETDLSRISYKEVRILGVNNRDLRTFKVDVHRGIEMLKTAPEGVMTVSESGLKSPDDLKLLHDKNINAALIGESFMREKSPGKALSNILTNF